MQNGSANTQLTNTITKLSKIFGDTIVASKIQQIRELTNNQTEQLQQLIQSFETLSPLIMERFTKQTQILTHTETSPVGSASMPVADTPARDDIQNNTASSPVLSGNSSDWLESLSGRSINEHTIQINPNF